jgi:hypothetical protein
MPGMRIWPSGVTSFDTRTRLAQHLTPLNKRGILTDGEEIGHGLVNCSTEDTRVKVSSWTGDLDLVVVDASETVCQARGLGVKPVVVYEMISA